MSDLSQQTKDLLADALGMQAGDISTQTALGSTSQWDSLAHMRLILAIEEKQGAPLGPNAIVSIVSAQDVEALLKG